MAQEQVFSFQPPARLEPVDEEQPNRVKDREHRPRSCDDSAVRGDSQAGMQFSERTGERLSYHAAKRAVTQPILDALRIPYHVLRDADEIPPVVKQIICTMEGQKIPVAILVPPFILVKD